MPVNSFLYRTDALTSRNAFLFAPPTRVNSNDNLYVCYGTNGPVAMSDPDALAYATAGNVLSTANRNALNTLVTSLKATSLWSKLHAVYPMVPGTSALADTYKLNLKNITQHVLTIPPSFTCTTQGLKSSAGSTEFCSSSTLNYDVADPNNMSMGVYYKTFSTSSSNNTDIAIFAAPSTLYSMVSRRNTGSTVLVNNAQYIHSTNGLASSGALSGLSPQPGLQVLRSNTTFAFYAEDFSLRSISTPVTGGNFQLGNDGAAPISFGFVGVFLTQSETIALDQIVNTFQSALDDPRQFLISDNVQTDTSIFYQIAQLRSWRQVQIIDTLITGLKTDSLWGLITCLFPFVGGTAYRHSISLKNPLSFQVQWAGNATHDSSGVTLGSLGSPTGVRLPNNSPYYGTYIVGGATFNGADFFTGDVPRENFYSTYSGTTYSDLGDYVGGRLTTTVSSDTNRYAATTRIGGISHIFVNGSSVSSAPTSTASFTGGIVQLSAGGANAATGRKTALCVIADSLTPAQHSLLYTHIQTYQTALGRAV